jgi:hypothetical protein
MNKRLRVFLLVALMIAIAVAPVMATEESDAQAFRSQCIDIWYELDYVRSRMMDSFLEFSKDSEENGTSMWGWSWSMLELGFLLDVPWNELKDLRDTAEAMLRKLRMQDVELDQDTWDAWNRLSFHVKRMKSATYTLRYAILSAIQGGASPSSEQEIWETVINLRLDMAEKQLLQVGYDMEVWR